MRRRARSASVIAALATVIAGGCTAISGLDGLRFDGGDSSSSGGASGGGGSLATSSASTGGGSAGGGCDAPSDCPVAAECFTATCKHHQCGSRAAPDHTKCGPGSATMVCAGGKCVGCADNTDCTPPQTCGGGGVANQCGCTVGFTCAMLAKTCGSADDGCGTTIDCDDGLKDGTESDVDCGGPVQSCATRCPHGKRCDVYTDCVATSAHCEQGFCCDVTCTTTCHSCGLYGSHGTCSVFPPGDQQPGYCDDTSGACGGKCACGAAGVCKLKSGEPCMDGVQCASSTCTAGSCA